jgi:hypothetical protein
MALWSLFVEGGGQSFSTQVTAENPKNAISSFLQSGGLRQWLKSRSGEGYPPLFSPSDIVLFAPMDGLINMHLCQMARDGKHLSVVMARTVMRN